MSNEIAKVRQTNGQQFIDDFKCCVTLVEFSWANQYLPVSKIAVWELSKKNKIIYTVIEGDDRMRSRMLIHDKATVK